MILFALVPRLGTAAQLRAQLDAIFEPSRVQKSAIALDGRHVAFAVHTGTVVEVQIFDIDQPSLPVRVPVENDPRSEIPFSSWVSSDLLAISTRTTLIASSASGESLRRFNPTPLPPEWLFHEPRAPKPAFRVIGVVPGSDSVLVESTEPDQLEPTEPPDFSRVNLALIRLNPRTGETKRVLNKHTLLPGGETLADASGQPRIFFNRGSFPRRFE